MRATLAFNWLSNLSFVVTQNHTFNKTLRKEIMKRSRIKNKANKSGKEEDKRLYNIQRNKVINYIINLRKHILKKNFQKETTQRISGTAVNLTLQTRVFVTMAESYFLKMIKF